MKKKIATISLTTMCVMFIIGLVIIFSSVRIGQNTGDTYVRNIRGSFDTNKVERIINGTTISYQMGGFLISLVGGFGILASGYALYKEI